MTFLPNASVVRDLVSRPTYGVAFPFDYASYWKESGHANTVHQKRKKCGKFTIRVNEPGAAEWVISNWKHRWDPDADGSEVRLRLAAAKWLEDHGRHHALVMYDGEKPIAGYTLASTPKNEVYVWQTSCRDSAYDSASPGTALMAHLFEWIEKRGPSVLDLGSDHAYKLRWASARGEYQDFIVSPFLHHASRKAAKAALFVKKNTKSLFTQLTSAWSIMGAEG
jgi:hypothetical protein